MQSLNSIRNKGSRHIIRNFVTLVLFVCISVLSCSETKDKDGTNPTKSSSSVTVFSVIGSSGQPILKKLVKEIVGKRYKGSLENEFGARVKLSGHRDFDEGTLKLVENNDVKVILIYRDLRNNLKQLVYRSDRDWCPDKFKKPKIHPNAFRYHQLVKPSNKDSSHLGFVEFYVEELGAEQVLDSIFAVSDWISHPQVLSVKLEDITNFSGNNYQQQLTTIRRIADFVNVELTETEVMNLAVECTDFLEKRALQEGFMTTWEEIFTEKDKEIFKRYWGDRLIELGYEKDHEW